MAALCIAACAVASAPGAVRAAAGGAAVAHAGATVAAGGAPAAGAARATPGEAVDHLTLGVYPPTVLSDEAGPRVVYVQLAGPDGTPLASDTALSVRVDTSNTAVATVPDPVLIPQGGSLGIGAVALTGAAGQVTLTAFSPLVSGATATLDVRGPLGATIPGRLQVRATPVYGFSGGADSDSIGVEIVGANGRAASATADTRVLLFSSDRTVLRLPTAIVIPAGQGAATALGRVVGTGPVTISALAQGYGSGSAEVRSTRAGPAIAAATIKVLPLFQPLPAGMPTVTDAVAVYAVDAGGRPTLLDCNALAVTASQPTVAQAQAGSFPCHAWASQFTIGMQAGADTGDSEVAVAAEGVIVGSATLQSSSQAATKVQAWLAPAAPFGADRSPGFAVVQVESTDGGPVPLTQATPVTFQVSGTGGTGLTVEGTIPAGGSWVAERVADLPGGDVTVNATVAGVGTATAKSKVYGAPAPIPSTRTGIPPLALHVLGLSIPVQLLIFALAAIVVGYLLYQLLGNGGEADGP